MRRTRSQKQMAWQGQQQAASDALAPAALPSRVMPDSAGDAPNRQQSPTPHAASGAAQAPGGAEPLHQPGSKPCQPAAGSPAAGSSATSPAAVAAQSSNGSSSSATASAAESVQAACHPTSPGQHSRVWPSGATGPAVVASGVFAEDAERQAEDSRCPSCFACTVLLPTPQQPSPDRPAAALAQSLLMRGTACRQAACTLTAGVMQQL